ncbi:oxidoreductase-like protein [Geopyxis carbonaria]|nr:oxidoreductase-like protein [Geopyxis carbonaria]
MKPRALISLRRCYHTIHPRPLGSYYDLLLTQPLPYTPTHTGINQAPSNQDPHPPASTPATQPYSPNKPSNAEEQAEREARARAVFGNREWTSGVQRETASREKGKMVAGVYIPPKPIEPDNCCMSGCVNCVLSQFVDELDEWKMAKRKAEIALKAQEGGKTKKKGKTEEGLWEGYEDIPVGLRVFMETEKRLKGKAGKAKVPA